MKYVKSLSFQHILVYGLSKSGKSSLVAELMKHNFNLIWCSFDGGHTIVDQLPVELVDKHFDLMWTPDTRETPFAFDTCRKLMKGTACKVCCAHGIVDCSTCSRNNAAFDERHFNRNNLRTIVVMDHLTQVTQSCLNVITKGKPDDYRPERDDWGSLHYHMSALLSTFQNAQFHVIALAQLEEAEQEDKTKKLGPSVGSSRFTRNVGQYFDHVIYTQVSNSMHKAGSSTGYQANVVTGSRAGIAIENEGALSLLPFFSGIPQQVEERVAAAVVAQAPTASSASGNAGAATPSVAELLAKLKK